MNSVVEVSYDADAFEDAKVVDCAPFQGLAQSQSEDNKLISENSAESSSDICKFCWLTESTESNPRFAACNCAGSMKYIHFECLKNWLRTKV